MKKFIISFLVLALFPLSLVMAQAGTPGGSTGSPQPPGTGTPEPSNRITI